MSTSIFPPPHPPWESRHGAHYLEVFANAANIEAELLALPWLTVRSARHEYFMSLMPREYKYGRKDDPIIYQSNRFTPQVLALMQEINKGLGAEHNVCFLNKYDNQHCSLGWHADDFIGMRADEPITCVSFGAQREIWVKDKRGFETPQGFVSAPPGGKQPEDQRFSLAPGSIFYMPAGYQNTHLHRIPKHDRPCRRRISLTFRSFF